MFFVTDIIMGPRRLAHGQGTSFCKVFHKYRTKDISHCYILFIASPVEFYLALHCAEDTVLLKALLNKFPLNVS